MANDTIKHKLYSIREFLSAETYMYIYQIYLVQNVTHANISING